MFQIQLIYVLSVSQKIGKHSSENASKGVAHKKEEDMKLDQLNVRCLRCSHIVPVCLIWKDLKSCGMAMEGETFRSEQLAGWQAVLEFQAEGKDGLADKQMFSQRL